jgi:hypothetical protein
MATMTVGNLSALGQRQREAHARLLEHRARRLHAARLLGVLRGRASRRSCSTCVTYCFMNLGAFLVVMAIAETERRRRDASTRSRASAVARRSWPQVMAIFLVSLTGLPPMAGFVGKFYLFAALLKAGGTWNWTVAVVGVLNSVISLFYYARVAAGDVPREGRDRAHDGASALRRDERRARRARRWCSASTGPRSTTSSLARSRWCAEHGKRGTRVDRPRRRPKRRGPRSFPERGPRCFRSALATLSSRAPRPSRSRCCWSRRQPTRTRRRPSPCPTSS